MYDGNDQKDNLRMGSRISGAGFGNRWKFGRLTEGTIQGRQKKLTGKFLLSRLNKKKNSYRLGKVSARLCWLEGRCSADSLKETMQTKQKGKIQNNMHTSTLNGKVNYKKQQIIKP